jgi:hypothetical protein
MQLGECILDFFALLLASGPPVALNSKEWTWVYLVPA